MDHTRDTATHGGHRTRMRQRVRNEGFEGLEPHELIEFLLFYAIPRQDVNELAHRLVETFGGAWGVLAATPNALAQVPGMGPRAAKWLALVGEAVSACTRLSPEDRPMFRTGMDALRYAARAERELDAPCCVQLCLDAKGRLIFRRKLCPSLSWGEPDTLREALRDMLACQAHNAVLLLMTGDQLAEPDAYDIEHASAYSDALRAAECQLLDVILAGGGALISMRGSGKFPTEIAPTATAQSMRENYLLHMPEGALQISDFCASD